MLNSWHDIDIKQPATPFSMQMIWPDLHDFKLLISNIRFYFQLVDRGSLGMVNLNAPTNRRSLVVRKYSNERRKTCNARIFRAIYNIKDHRNQNNLLVLVFIRSITINRNKRKTTMKLIIVALLIATFFLVAVHSEPVLLESVGGLLHGILGFGGDGSAESPPKEGPPGAEAGKGAAPPKGA